MATLIPASGIWSPAGGPMSWALVPFGRPVSYRCPPLTSGTAGEAQRTAAGPPVIPAPAPAGIGSRSSRWQPGARPGPRTGEVSVGTDGKPLEPADSQLFSAR